MGEGPAVDKPAGRPRAILFMCGMNSIRSPMAEVIAKRLLPPDIYVQSAGIRAGEQDPFVDVVLQEIGLRLARHQSRTLDDLEDDYFDIIVTLSPESHHQALERTRSTAVEVVYWPTVDPSLEMGQREQVLEAYRRVRDDLWRRIEDRFVRAHVQSAQTI